MDISGRTNPMPASQASTIPNPFAGNGGPGPNLTIEATPEMRRGVYADVASVRTNGGTSMIDFMLIDSADPSGDARGILSSRVYMSNESIIALRDMLVDATKDWRRVQQ